MGQRLAIRIPDVALELHGHFGGGCQVGGEPVPAGGGHGEAEGGVAANGMDLAGLGEGDGGRVGCLCGLRDLRNLRNLGGPGGCGPQGQGQGTRDESAGGGSPQLPTGARPDGSQYIYIS
ncbi:MAG: hypothetical protein OXC53_04275 [Rhodobacteraceae bacterium]|nr:hypothetical protein [Paracoccaceae bacterium]